MGSIPTRATKCSPLRKDKECTKLIAVMHVIPVRNIEDFSSSTCASGGIGSHAGLRNQCRKACGFESHLAYRQKLN